MTDKRFSDILTRVVAELTDPQSCKELSHQYCDGEPLPSLADLNEIIELCRAVLFPGYFGYSHVSDSRLTKVGKFLREHHLDELPQLFNVLIGDMSFVGPRPERKYFIDLIKNENPDYDYIYLMRPGVTSMATIYNGYTDTMEKMLIRLQMDLDYLQNRSLWLDLKIIITTVLKILKGKKF